MNNFSKKFYRKEIKRNGAVAGRRCGVERGLGFMYVFLEKGGYSIFI